MEHREISILGAGLVGSLLASLLAQKGIDVEVFEMRDDPRKSATAEGRSINLALSHRGIEALKMAGVYEQIAPELIPMNGRMMHDKDGNLSFQPYGKENQHINSVSRSGLNKLLISNAERHGARLSFGHKCGAVDIGQSIIHFETPEPKTISSRVVIGADGAYSVLRQAMQKMDRFDFSQHYIAHGYKELSIPPLRGDFALEPNYLHIWPRGNFMLIALPNPDKSFTCTLFFPFEGDLSFASIDEDNKAQAFFEQYFKDIVPLIPDLMEQFRQNPASPLVTIKAFPWVKNRCLLIGDAAHAIVPFYGQGMNAGFEDCRLLMQWGEAFNFDWEKLLPHFSSHRKKDADAISSLALKNFVEMRDKVANQRFLDVKMLEARLQQQYPEVWVPLYSMVTFSDMPYYKAQHLGEIQEYLMQKLPEGFDPETYPLQPIIDEFSALVQDAR